MSAFDRHPLRADYEAAALRFPPKNAVEIMRAMHRRSLGGKVDVPRARYLSPQNKRVRFAVDLERARAKEFPTRETRQLRRQVARLGISRFIPEYIAGPDEV